MVRKWRRVDEPGLEVFELAPDADGFRAVSMTVHAGAEPFGAAYAWLLDRDWRTRRLDLGLTSPRQREMRIERASGGWRIDGREEPGLGTCEEIDLSATPFCNGLAIKRLKGPGESADEPGADSPAPHPALRATFSPLRGAKEPCSPLAPSKTGRGMG